MVKKYLRAAYLLGALATASGCGDVVKLDALSDGGPSEAGSNTTRGTTPVNSGMATGTAGTSTTGTSTAGTGTANAGTKDTESNDNGPTNDAGVDAAITTLYERLGKHAGIRAAIDAIIAQELLNADIASYFFFQAGAPGNGHPTAGDVEECFTDLVALAAGGPETYPTTVATVDGEVVTVGNGGAEAADAGTYTCRWDMTAIHAPLLISGGTFDEFVMIASAELRTRGVATADVAALTADLETFKTAIVSPAYAGAGLQPFPGNLDGGGGG
jgi:hypothetical protein